MNRAFARPRLLCFIVLLSLAAMADAQSAAPVFPDPGNPSMSRENQRALGQQAAAQVYEQMPVLPDSSPETQYVRQLGQKLVATIPAQYSWPFEFHVIPQKEINAFALPGGPMFINVGTITAAANESELAGVMAHEMSHVYMQHSAKQAGKAQTTGLIAGIAGAILGGAVGGAAGQLGQMGIQMGAQGLMAKYSRGDESQADAVGAVILYKAGYNPQGMADFFKTLASQGGSGGPSWFASHPDPGNRQQAIQKEIRNWPPKNYVGSSAAFEQVRQHALGVKVYTGEEIAQGAKTGEWKALNKKNGATFNPSGGSALERTSASAPARATPVALQSVLPSQRMVSADLGPLKVQHPENWQVRMPQKRGDFVSIAPGAGVTANGVGYGVLLNGIAPQGGANLDDITSQLVQQMEQDNALEPLGNPQSTTVGGMPGRSVMLQSASPFPNAKGESQKERDWLVTAQQRDGSVIFMVFVAPQTDFPRFQSTYDAMLRSVQFK